VRRPGRTATLAAPPRLLLTGATGGLVALASAGVVLLVATATASVTPPAGGALPPLGARTPWAGAGVVVPTPTQAPATPRQPGPAAYAGAAAIVLQGPQLKPPVRRTVPLTSVQPAALRSAGPAVPPPADARPVVVAAPSPVASPPAFDALLRAALRWSDPHATAASSGADLDDDAEDDENSSAPSVQLLTAGRLHLVGQPAGPPAAAQAHRRGSAGPAKHRPADRPATRGDVADRHQAAPTGHRVAGRTEMARGDRDVPRRHRAPSAQPRTGSRADEDRHHGERRHGERGERRDRDRSRD
jgi:hypothetical protein